jgi:predicted DsbA family dithiol-disulfide isomerase
VIKIIILSDPICPWCYIGKKCFDEAIKQFDSHYFSIKWLPFQLNPKMPKEGMDRKNYLIKKFGNEKKTIEVYTPIVNKFNENEIDFDLSKIQTTPNTFNANQLIYWSQLEGKGNDIVENLFKAYFLEGKNLGDINCLIEIGMKSGLTKKITSTVFENTKDIKKVQDIENKYRKAGVSGVPTFIINNDYVVPGAQSTDFWQGVLKELTQKYRRMYS